MSSTTENSQSNSGLASEVKTTIVFAAIALVCLVVTGILKLSNRSQPIEEYGKVGQAFYPDFKDPTVATSLSVSTVTGELQLAEFSVKQADNGRWVIPSHHNYPADAAEQLANTASSVIGIKRGAMVTRWPSDHARYGVVDPDQESLNVDEVDGVGKRLTLMGKDDAILASFIIGKQVEGETGKYYVRHPKEDETYVTDLTIELSTKFKDWVKTDLLDINNADVRTVAVNDYTFDELRGSLTRSVFSNLSRNEMSDPWVLAELDDDSKEVNKQAIDDSVNTLGSLAIIGVRPKQQGLQPDFTFDTSVRDPSDIQRDLLQRGFLLQPSQADPRKLELLAKEGELSVGTADGIVYKLYFGRAFTGSDEDLEIGIDSAAASSDSSESKDENKSDAAEDTEDADSETDESKKPGRYLFIRVLVDETLLDLGTEPVKPVMSQELIEARTAAEAEKEAEPKAGDSKEGSEEASGEAAEAGDADAASDEGDKKEQSAEEKYAELKLAYDMAVDQYDIDKQAYDANKSKIEEANKKAEELNRRFEQWYYVIPGDSYDKLALDRDAILKEKEAAPAVPPAPGTDPSISPSIPSGLPGLNPPTQPAPTEPPVAEPAPATGEKETAKKGTPSEPATGEAGDAKDSKPADENKKDQGQPAQDESKETPDPGEEASKPAKEPEPPAENKEAGGEKNPASEQEGETSPEKSDGKEADSEPGDSSSGEATEGSEGDGSEKEG